MYVRADTETKNVMCVPEEEVPGGRGEKSTPQKRGENREDSICPLTRSKVLPRGGPSEFPYIDYVGGEVPFQGGFVGLLGGWTSPSLGFGWLGDQPTSNLNQPLSI